MEMDLIRYLDDMRREQKQDVERLEAKMDQTISKIDDSLVHVDRKVNLHETRITVLEGTRKTVRWAIGGIFMAAAGLILEVLFNHIFIAHTAAGK